jgi:TetR/AcrR family transcriptional repressor of nem operon
MSTRAPVALAPTVRTHTAARALDAAERLVQTKGFNWLSYADVAGALGIRKASLHHHFATKGDLGRALIERYTERFAAELAAIDAERTQVWTKLERYVGLYEAVLRGEGLCLCGMLAAEYSSLPNDMRTAIRAFFDLNERWLAGIVKQGRAVRRFHERGRPEEVARLVLGALEGAMLVARPYNDVERFASSAAQILDSLSASSPPRRAPRRRRSLRRARAAT